MKCYVFEAWKVKNTYRGRYLFRRYNSTPVGWSSQILTNLEHIRIYILPLLSDSVHFRDSYEGSQLQRIKITSN